jgi:hypothetical protein
MLRLFSQIDYFSAAKVFEDEISLARIRSTVLKRVPPPYHLIEAFRMVLEK